MARRDWASFAFLTAVLLSVGPIRTLAQTSFVVCLPSFDWMYNSLQQSPCTVSAFLQAACNGGEFTYDPLPDGYHYIGPTGNQNNKCQCSTVTYNTVSACGLCQNHTIINWDEWGYNCSNIYPGFLPQGVPGTTAVPQWAFQNVSSGLFNVALAQSVGDSPESTLTHAQSTISAPPTSTSAFVISTSISLIPKSSSFSGSKINVGAIAGGVVGGVVGIGLIAAAVIFFFWKQRRSQIPSSAPYAAGAVSPSGFTKPVPLSPQMAQPCSLYNPSDPSTFPPPPGRYSGVPQV